MIVLAGVDESPMAAEVLEAALAEAERRDAELHVVHVLRPYVGYLEVPIDTAALADAERANVWAPLEPLLAAAPMPTKRIDLEGYPPDVLVDYAKEVGADLVVVGTRGRGEFASFILGSTSHRTIHLAPCDVLVVRPKKA